MKILHFVPAYAPAWSYGGPVRSISMLAEEQVRQGNDVTVFTTDAGIPPGNVNVDGRSMLRNGVKVHYFPREKGFGIKSRTLGEAIRTRVGEFELMHLSAIWHPVARAAHVAARKKQVPVIISPRGALGPYAWRRRRLLKYAYYLLFERSHFKAAAGFHFTSEKESSESALYSFGRSFCIVPNGIDEQVWRRQPEAGRSWRSTQGISGDEWLVLYTGRLHHKKGLEILPAALALIHSLSPGMAVRLVIVGPNEDGTLERLQKQADLSRVTGSIHWVETVPEKELPAIYSAADVFVMPSLHENFGNSAVEALACGCHSLVSTETGCVEFCKECGMETVLEHSAIAWAGAISRTIKRGRRSITLADRSHLMAKIGLPATTAAMLRFYEVVLSSRSTRQGASTPMRIRLHAR